MSNEEKDVPNGELAPVSSELQLADIRIKDLEMQLQAAQQEIAKLREELALAPASSHLPG